MFDRRAFELSGKLVGDIEEYIDEHSADEIREAEYGGGYDRERRTRGGRYLESTAKLVAIPGEADEEEPDEADYEELEDQIVYAEAAAPSFPDV